MDIQSVIKSIAPFIPNCSGDDKTKFSMALAGNQKFIGNLLMIAQVFGHQIIDETNIKTIEHEDSTELKNLFNSFGSDKSNSHNYEILYANILRDRENIKSVVEIGMGTNNTTVLSNMGSDGKPGASLRAFREYLPNAQIYGGDVDRGILFNEDRIQTFFVDQLRLETIDNFFNNLPDDLDLIIDDGLHSPEANLNVLMFGISKIKVGGWCVVEDIPDQSMDLWKIVSLLISNNYDKYLLKADKGNLFVINRNA
jgi:hypothetical protein